ncbi:MAG: trypsin-like peptidase domain-containing protein, partial [Planctomycetales bacterium]|nr:trypsin-like peptidase domain-containing protein [Planctomycetales bacterium]
MRQNSLLVTLCLAIAWMAGMGIGDSGLSRSMGQLPSPPAGGTFAPPSIPRATGVSELPPPSLGNGAVGNGALGNIALGGRPQDDEELLPEERVNIAVYENCNRSVVHIATRSIAMESFQQVSLREGSGSGFVLDRQGMILTNQHVIDGAKEISVSLSNGLSYPAVLVGQDPDTDIAVLKIDAPAEHLLPVTWGDSQTLRVGQKIYAIGNPFGLERTMSTGMISSLNRQIPSRAGRTMRSLIQIDAALNQG